MIIKLKCCTMSTQRTSTHTGVGVGVGKADLCFWDLSRWFLSSKRRTNEWTNDFKWRQKIVSSNGDNNRRPLIVRLWDIRKLNITQKCWELANTEIKQEISPKGRKICGTHRGKNPKTNEIIVISVKSCSTIAVIHCLCISSYASTHGICRIFCFSRGIVYTRTSKQWKYLKYFN